MNQEKKILCPCCSCDFTDNSIFLVGVSKFCSICQEFFSRDDLKVCPQCKNQVIYKKSGDAEWYYCQACMRNWDVGKELNWDSWKTHYQVCIGCANTDYNDAEFTQDQIDNYRCSACERKLWEKQMEDINLIKNGFFACDCQTFTYEQLNSLEGMKRKLEKDWNFNWTCPQCKQKPVFCRNKEDQQKMALKVEMVEHPPHYCSGGLEAIDIIEAFSLNFNLGNAVKYILRSGKKGCAVQDLQKAIWYLKRQAESK